MYVENIWKTFFKAVIDIKAENMFLSAYCIAS